MNTASSLPPRSIDWPSSRSTDVERAATDPRLEPPPSLGADPMERWAWVREIVRTAATPLLPVDRVRRIEAYVRPDRQMTSRHGELDPITVIALLWFQQDHGLPLSGVPDGPTLALLTQIWPSLDRAATRKLTRPGVIVPSHATPLQRYLKYRAAILKLGGVFDEEHRAVNVLVLTHADLVIGEDGLTVRSTASSQRSFVTVSLWVERAGGTDDGELLGVTARERPGLVQPVLFVDGARTPSLEPGQIVCQLDRSSGAVRTKRALLPRFPTDPQALPLNAPALRLEHPGVTPEAVARIDADRLTWDRFHAELSASHRERARRRRWQGLRVTVMDASQLEALT